jgi:hypothetical protein
MGEIDEWLALATLERSRPSENPWVICWAFAHWTSGAQRNALSLYSSENSLTY